MFVLVGLSFYIFPIYLLRKFIVYLVYFDSNEYAYKNVPRHWIFYTLVYSILFGFWNMTPLLIKLFGAARDPDSVKAKQKVTWRIQRNVSIAHT